MTKRTDFEPPPVLDFRRNDNKGLTISPAGWR